MSLREYLDQREKELLREIDVLAEQSAQRKAELEEVRVARKAIGTDDTQAEPPSPAETSTMRMLTKRTLKERFPNGATITQIIDHIKDAWHRDLDRNNLSPLLSRLYRHGELGRIPSTRGWFLVKPDGRIQGFLPYMDQRASRIAWCQPETVAGDPNYEPLRLYGQVASE